MCVMKKMLILLSFIVLMSMSSYVVAAIVVDHEHGEAVMHSGGVDDYGCHHDHKRGGYHCH